MRFLSGVIGLSVAEINNSEQNCVELLIRGEIDAQDTEFAVEKLCPRISDLFDISPIWHGGMTGVMQLITLVIAEKKMMEIGGNENFY